MTGGATALVLAASATAMAAGGMGADLTTIAGAPTAACGPHGYTTNLPCQGTVARVDYRTTTGHIEQLSVQGGQSWRGDDLTATAAAPLVAGDPDGFETDLTGQGPVRSRGLPDQPRPHRGTVGGVTPPQSTHRDNYDT